MASDDKIKGRNLRRKWLQRRLGPIFSALDLNPKHQISGVGFACCSGGYVKISVIRRPIAITAGEGGDAQQPFKTQTLIICAPPRHNSRSK